MVVAYLNRLYPDSRLVTMTNHRKDYILYVRYVDAH